MKIEYIHSYLVTYRLQNISEASKQLFISQQGLSRQINHLEQKLGVVLFERTNSGVTPTEISTKLYPFFEQSYSSFLEAKELIERGKDKKAHTLKIAFCNGISRGFNSRFLTEYQELFPSCSIELQEWPKQLCIEQLKNDEIDMTFLINPFNKHHFQCQEIMKGYMYLAMHESHPLAKSAQPLDISFLDGQEIITGPMESSLRELFDYYCQLYNIQPVIKSASSFCLEIVNSMKSNTGIATITPVMAKQIINSSIVIRQLSVSEPCILYCCVSNDRPMRPCLRSFFQYIVDYFNTEPGFV